MFKKNDKLDLELKDKIIEIEAGIEGNVKFTAPHSGPPFSVSLLF